MPDKVDTVTLALAADVECEAVVSLLERAGLPTRDLASGGVVELHVARISNEIVCAIGLERYGSTGLLRSLVVASSHRGEGLGARLVSQIERRARQLSIEQLVLLTTTADAFFEQRGYRRVDRSTVPSPVLESEEFQSLCPASAVCMSKQLPPESNP
ncbi:MAG TPA: arsenic resistance N-acetyltransferase ArsN2 [Steroidobacteraceae bacterium]|nr:arsenic resistance N-acetyltransferase ArsN2 [Steroidobacteraceae bacterium]